jgi:hypothetical protein
MFVLMFLFGVSMYEMISDYTFSLHVSVLSEPSARQEILTIPISPLFYQKRCCGGELTIMGYQINPM